MAELIEQTEKDMPERKSPAITAAISVILAEVKALKQKVHALSRSFELDELKIGSEHGHSNWGAVYDDQKVGGRWTSLESTKHILDFKSFCKRAPEGHMYTVADRQHHSCFI